MSADADEKDTLGDAMLRSSQISQDGKSQMMSVSSSVVDMARHGGDQQDDVDTLGTALLVASRQGSPVTPWWKNQFAPID